MRIDGTLPRVLAHFSMARFDLANFPVEIATPIALCLTSHNNFGTCLKACTFKHSLASVWAGPSRCLKPSRP